MHKHKSKTTPIESGNGYDPIVAALADMIEEFAIEGARKQLANGTIHVSADPEQAAT